MKRAIVAGLAGYVVITSLTAISFVVMNGAGLPLNDPQWLVAKLLIGIVGGLLGGAVAAALAGPRAQQTVMALAALMTVLSLVAVIVMFGSEPLWFQALLIVCTGPAIVLGSALFRRRAQRA